MMKMFLRIVDYLLYKQAMRAWKQGKGPTIWSGDGKSDQPSSLPETGMNGTMTSTSGDKQLETSDKARDRRNVYPFW